MSLSTMPLANQKEYEDLRYELIKTVEENGHEEPDVYMDSVGIPTMGVGFGLHVRKNIEQILIDGFGFDFRADTELKATATAIELEVSNIRGEFAAFKNQYQADNPLDADATEKERNAWGVSATQYASDQFTNEAIQQRLNVAYQEADTANTGPFIIQSLGELSAADRIRTIFDELSKGYEEDLTRLLSNSEFTTEPYPRERLALISLTYNLGQSGVTETASLINENTDEARIEAWFKIRYNMNGTTGTANRRYLESAIFGLYPNGAVTADYAKKVVDKIIGNLDQIQTEETAYSSGKAVSNWDLSSSMLALVGGQTSLGKALAKEPAVTQYVLDQYLNDSELRSLVSGTVFDNVVLSLKLDDTRPDKIAAYNHRVAYDDDLLVNVNDEDALLSGGRGDDVLIGNDQKDKVWGLEGNDKLFGQGGEDTLMGYSGVDKLYGGDEKDYLYAGSDTDFSTTDEDYLYGGKGDDELYGDAGNDRLDGGEGKDAMEGGKGNDTYVVDHAEDTVIELADEGSQDTVLAKIDYELENDNHVENLILQSGVISGKGNNLDNTIVGNEGENVLSGGTGKDKIYGGNGGDYIFADNMDAAFSALIPSADVSKNELYGGAGNDRLFGADGDDLLEGETGNDYIVGGGGADEIKGGEDVDVLVGSAGEDTIIGGIGNDVLAGGGLFDGSIGNAWLKDDGEKDTLQGGEGFDRYYADPGDVISDSDGAGVIYFQCAEAGGLAGYEGGRWRRLGSAIETGVGTGEFQAWHGPYELTYQLDGDVLIINGGELTIENFSEGDFGISLIKKSESSKSRLPKPPPTPASPLILDLDGDGIETLGHENKIHFDLDNTGYAELTGWVGKDDGLLVFDRNGNGEIDNGLELFGNYTKLKSGEYADNGFTALAELDSNSDGKVTYEDEDFSQLKVWQDVDSNGTVDSGELKTLDELGIQSFYLGYIASSEIDEHGNAHAQVGQYELLNGERHEMTDVWFNTNKQDSIDLSAIEVDESIAILPNIEGAGNSSSLHQAMASDQSGVLKSLVESFVNSNSYSDRSKLIDSIIFHWSGETGGYEQHYQSPVDRRKIHSLEKFYGNELDDPRGSGWVYSMIYDRLFKQFSNSIYSQLVSQTSLKDYYDTIAFTTDSNGESLVNYDSLIEKLFDELGTLTDLESRDLLSDIYTMVDGINPYESSEFSFSEGQSISQFKIQIDNYIDAGRHLDLYGDDFLSPDSSHAQEIQIAARRLKNLTAGATIYSDVIEGTLGDDILDGFAGNDTIRTGDGDDILIGGLGNDRLVGGRGTDEYIYQVGDGNDSILNDSSDGTEDTIRIYGVAESDLIINRQDDDLLIRFNGQEGSIRVEGHFKNEGINSNYIYGVVLDDGTRLDLRNDVYQSLYQSITSTGDIYHATLGDDVIDTLEGDDELYGKSGNDILSGSAGDDQIYGDDGDDTLNGGDGHDRLYGGAGADILNGGSGNDVMAGGQGDDTFIYKLNDGLDAFVDNEGVNTIEFGEGISQSDLVVSRSSLDLVIDFAGRPTDQIILPDFFSFHSGEFNNTFTLKFSDGSVVTSVDLGQLTLSGTDDNDVLYGLKSENTLTGFGGDDLIYGNDLDDVIDGGKGNDRLLGRSGSDVYLYNIGDGNDIILDASTDGDTNVLRLGPDISESNLVMKRSENDLVISFNNNDGQVSINNYFLSDSYQLDIELSSSKVFSVDEIRTLVVTSTSGDDDIEAFDNDETIYLGSGNDRIKGNGGNDFLYGEEGNDVLLGGLGDDTLVGGADNDSLYGNQGNDVLIGGSGSNSVNGGDGNDTLETESGLLNGGEGNDVYIYREGFGDVTIINSDYSTGRSDIIRFAEGISPEDVDLGISDAGNYGGGDLVIRVEGHGTITVRNHFLNFISSNSSPKGEIGDAINSIEFSDGTSWALSEINRRASIGNDNNNYLYGIDSGSQIEGHAGNDVLQGGIGDDTLDGGIGDDTLDGGEGSDVYFYRLGDGNDTIRNDHSSQDSIDTLRFDSGINPQDVTVSSDFNYGLKLSISNGDVITIEDWFRESSEVDYLIDRVEFSDGTVWTTEQLTDLSQVSTDGNDAIRGFADEADDFSGGLGNDSLYGNKGNDLLNGDEGDDRLQGDDGNDVLVGGIGNDSLWGGNGVDTYRFGSDFGVDTIWETTNAEQNTIDLVDGLAPDQVNYKRYNDNLVLTISGDYSNAVIFKNFFTDGFSNNHFIYSDGSAFDSDSTQGVYLVADQSELAGMPGEFDPTNDELGHAGLIYNPGLIGFKLTGTQYNDYLIGQHLDDTLIGKGGDDVIFGGAGNDTITAYGTSALFGESGDDTINLSSGEAHGGEGNDSINVWWSNSIVSGGKGDDEISLHLPDEGEATRVNYNVGDGKDTIEVFGGRSTIVFGEGISLSDISPFYDDFQNQLVLFLDSSNSITFKYLTEANQTVNGRPVLSDGKEVSLEFSDGSKFTIEEMFNVFYGTYGKTDAFDSEAGDFDHYVTGQDSLDDQYDFGFENSNSYYVQTLGGNDTVFGAQGNDRLEGGAGDDDLIGDAGDDALFGGEGNDELEGGTGNDLLSGGSGSNTYYYVGPSSEDPDFGSFGHDEIIVDGNDTIAFYDQALAGLSFSRNQGNDLIISVTGDASSQITVKDWFLGASHQLTIENFNDDGPVGQLTATDINAQIDDIEPRLPPVLNGSVNDQSIQQGQNLNLAISASLFTDTGAIQYSATLADGSELPAWLSFDATNLTFSGTPENADVGDVSVTIIATDTHGLTNSTNFTIAVANVNDAPVLENAISDQIVFNNKTLNVDLSSVFMEIDQGDSFTLSVTLADGSPLPSWIVFDSNTQTLVATHSSENLGAISILVTATDQFNAQTSTQFNLEVSDAEEFESVITGTANGEQLLGTSAQDLMQGLAGNDQLYGFGGNDQLEGGAGDDRLQGGNGSNTGSGDDVLIGGEGNDILVGEDGNDQLDGGNGDDHYYYYAGTGQDTLTDSGDGQDVLFFNDASLDRLSFHQQGNDLIVLIDGDLTQQVLVKDHFLGGNYEIYVQPDGGYTQTPAQIASMLSALPTDNGGGDNGGGDNGGGDNGGGDNGTVTDLNGDNSLTGTANTDIIAAGEGNDTLSGLAGNDRLIGGKGNDVYLLGSNSGQDIIADTEGSNIIRFVDGINFNDVASGIVKYGDDLILRIGSGGDEVQVENFFTVANTVETIEFETGGSISADQIFGLYGLSAPTTAVASGDIAAGDSGDNSVTSGSGNDIVLGLDGNDTLFGLEGDDTLLGGNGDDTYVIGANSGTDLIIDTDGTNRIRFVDGISFNDVASGLTGSGDDLILNIASTGNQVRINNFFSLANTISSLEFESGGEITAAQLYGAFGRAAPTATQITETGFGLDSNAQSEALMSAMASFDVAEETGDSNILDPNRNQTTLMNEVA